MRINLCGNLENGCGLQNDYEVLRARLEALGHEVRGIHFTRPEGAQMADVNISLELITPYLFQYAAEQWAVPNPEWWFPNLHSRNISVIKRFLCKTRDCKDLFEPLAPGRCFLMGFESKDCLVPDVEQEPTFLHMIGKSQFKNTEAVIQAWKEFQIPYPLTLVSEQAEYHQAAYGCPTIRVIKRVSNEEKRILLSRNLFHLCPSKYEGWGHYIHEALSARGIVITTDAAPMRDFHGIPAALLVPVKNNIAAHGITHLNVVSPTAIRDAVERAIELPTAEIEFLTREARDAFEAEVVDFRAATHDIFSVGVPELLR